MAKHFAVDIRAARNGEKEKKRNAGGARPTGLAGYPSAQAESPSVSPDLSSSSAPPVGHADTAMPGDVPAQAACPAVLSELSSQPACPARGAVPSFCDFRDCIQQIEQADQKRPRLTSEEAH